MDARARTRPSPRGVSRPRALASASGLTPSLSRAHALSNLQKIRDLLVVD